MAPKFRWFEWVAKFWRLELIKVVVVGVGVVVDVVVVDVVVVVIIGVGVGVGDVVDRVSCQVSATNFRKKRLISENFPISILKRKSRSELVCQPCHVTNCDVTWRTVTSCDELWRHVTLCQKPFLVFLDVLRGKLPRSCYDSLWWNLTLEKLWLRGSKMDDSISMRKQRIGGSGVFTTKESGASIS